MSTKKRSATSEKELKATVEKLSSKLDRAKAKKQQWKKKAGQLEKTAAKSQTQVEKLTKRLEAARSSGESKPAGSKEPAALEQPAIDATTSPDTAVPTASADAPDSSWTVVQLREAARSRGLTGLSNKSKAQLLEALS